MYLIALNSVPCLNRDLEPHRVSEFGEATIQIYGHHDSTRLEEVSPYVLSQYWETCTSTWSKCIVPLLIYCSAAIKFLPVRKALFYTSPRSRHPPRCPNPLG